MRPEAGPTPWRTSPPSARRPSPSVGSDATRRVTPARASERRRIDTSGIVGIRPTGRRSKPDPWRRGPHLKQQIVRIDRGAVGQPMSRVVQQRLLASAAPPGGPARLLLADYHFGAAPPTVLASLRRRPGVVTRDSRFRILSFRGVTAATPNVAEVEQALGVRIADDDLKGLGRAAERVRSALGARALVVTRGSRGMSLFEKGARPVLLPGFGSDEVADVTGAGDTVISAFTLARGGADYVQAARPANIAGGIVVMKRGTATVSPAELLRAIAGGSPLAATGRVSPSRIGEVGEATSWIQAVPTTSMMHRPPSPGRQDAEGGSRPWAARRTGIRFGRARGLPEGTSRRGRARAGPGSLPRPRLRPRGSSRAGRPSSWRSGGAPARRVRLPAGAY